VIDVAVIGGGIAGLSVAARISPFAKVVVLEGEAALGYHASGRSAALYEENYGKPAVKVLNKASKAFHVDGGYLSPRGFMILCRQGEDAAFETDMHELQSPEISLGEAHSRVPILNQNITRASYHANALDIDTDRMLQDFAKVVRQNGSSVRTKAFVSAIERTASGWIIHMGDDTLAARRLVNAAGAWADQIAQLAHVHPIGLLPMRRSMARIPAPGGHDVSNWPMFFGTGETWYAKPDAGSLIVSPADEEPVDPHDAWAEDMVLAEGFDRYQDHVTVPVSRPTSTWAGLRSFAPDRLLVLGPDPEDESFIWCAGQGGYGFATAPAASQLTAQLALGQSPDFDQTTVDAFSPARFAGD
jgi:glycine/D-amino acid oxidase-like deaminating enzyme